jgi:ribose-phosphate pyrophosphokinase
VNEFVITATRSMKSYASRVAGLLSKFASFAEFAEKLDGTELLRVDQFADGEKEAVITESIRGKDVVLFASSARNEAGVGTNDAKIELYHAIDALKRAQAEKILVFEPFISCSRSDRTARRSSVGLWIHLKILRSLGVKHFVTYQLHSDKSKSMLDPTTAILDDIPALTLLMQRLCDVYIKDMETLEKVVRPTWAFCSVDAGGEKLARNFSNSFGVPLVVAHKQRDYSKCNTIECVNILSAEPIAGKVIWIVDDLIDTAGSVDTLIRALAPMKPAEINLMAVHPIFSKPASERLKKLTQEGFLRHLIVTDTVTCDADFCAEIPNLEVVPSVEYSAKVVQTIMTNRSMSKLLREFNAEIYLGSPTLFHPN